ncbi:MAG TPA: bifunctional rhamnulose-1-phosphate aldolase/short-chain dehydrogenase [bacterium]|jgi:rhamnulose-1-phosphate aldolase/alcohol dehydrogenase|nr:bifunctional rhamnulose-1-phosphate aldolase/short-chain dehydrogenase [bacterium]
MSPSSSDSIRDLLDMSHAAGEEESWVLHGGGNSSVKDWHVSRLGKRVRALWVKASGSDLRTLREKDLAPLDLEALLQLRRFDALSDEAMLEELALASLKVGAPRGSIETLLHAFLPAAYVLHTHADSTAALMDTPHSLRHVDRCFMGAVGFVPYQRPGFSLALATSRRYAALSVQRSTPLRGILLDKHGLVTWGDTAQEALAWTRRLLARSRRYVTAPSRRKAPRTKPVARPAVPSLRDWMPALRGALGQAERQILHWDASPAAVEFSLRPDAAALCAGGPATPDHLLYTKPRALFLDLSARRSAAALVQGRVAAYRRWYESYFERYAPKNSLRMDTAPRVLVLRGLGVLTTGKDPKTALIASDIFRHSRWVRTHAAALESYTSISLKQIGDFEYWPLENFKLTLAPPEKELSRRVVLVTGAGRGIGKACALRLAEAGACVAALDRDAASVGRVAEEIKAAQGPGRALALTADITDEGAVAAAFDSVLRQWGGLDMLVNNAGIARTGAVEKLSLKDWRDSLEVNATGHFLVAREAVKIMKAQGLGGSMVFVSSKNVLSPGKDFSAYSASKAAQTQLAKVLALELAPFAIRVNSVTPDGVFEDSGLWESIGPSRAKAQDIAAADLKDFYVQRNLLRLEVRPRDVAEAVLFLLSERSSRTTGTLLPVDGGLKDAFPR